VIVNGVAGIGSLARTAIVVPAEQRCGQLENLFRARPELRSVVVSDGARLGLVMRGQFDHIMSGPFGFGQALWAHRPVSLVTDWSPVIVPAATTVATASYALRIRPDDRRYDDLLVDLGAHGIGLVSAPHLFDELASQFAVRAIRDDLTGLANRAHFLDLLSAACADTVTDRVVVVFIDLDGMKRINDSHGHRIGDSVLGAVGRQLHSALDPGEIAARLGGDEFAVLTRLPRNLPADIAALQLGHRYLLAVTARDGRDPLAPGRQCRRRRQRGPRRSADAAQ